MAGGGAAGAAVTNRHFSLVLCGRCSVSHFLSVIQGQRHILILTCLPHWSAGRGERGSRGLSPLLQTSLIV